MINYSRMKKELSKAGNSLYNGGIALILFPIVSLFFGLLVFSTRWQPDKLQNIIIGYSVLNMALLVYAGGSFLGAGKKLIALDEEEQKED
jgi:hypothetical protein